MFFRVFFLIAVQIVVITFTTELARANTSEHKGETAQAKSLNNFYLKLSLAESNLVDEVIKTQLSESSDKPIEDLYSYEDLEKLIKEKKVKTIDELIEVLPRDYKKGFALIYKTRALNRGHATPVRPRILVFGTTGRLMITINSHPEGRRAKAGDTEIIESIEFTSTGAKLREFHLDGINVPNTNVDVNPARCINCHDTRPRGLWEPFNLWPGVYGSISRGGVDFIKFGTTEYDGFQKFLKERKKNLRYAAFPLAVTTLSDLSNRAEKMNLKIIAPFDKERMTDALVVGDGLTFNPNQRLGIIIANHNFNRLGQIIDSVPQEKKAAFQYLIKSMELDEKGSHPKLGTFTNLYEDKKYECLKIIDSFFPEKFFSPLLPKYIEFHKNILKLARFNYIDVKNDAEFENMGLSKVTPGLDDTDFSDIFTIKRNLFYDAFSPPLLRDFAQMNKQQTLGQGSTLIPFLFNVMGIPQVSYSSTARGNFYNLFYGNQLSCIGPRGEFPSSRWNCYLEDSEAFITLHLPKTFYTDPDIDKMNCEKLAAKSKEAISKLKKI